MKTCPNCGFKEEAKNAAPVTEAKADEKQVAKQGYKI